MIYFSAAAVAEDFTGSGCVMHFWRYIKNTVGKRHCEATSCFNSREERKIFQWTHSGWSPFSFVTGCFSWLNFMGIFQKEFFILLLPLASFFIKQLVFWIAVRAVVFHVFFIAESCPSDFSAPILSLEECLPVWRRDMLNVCWQFARAFLYDFQTIDFVLGW